MQSNQLQRKTCGATRLLSGLGLAGIMLAAGAAHAATVYAWSVGGFSNGEGLSTFDAATPQTRTIVSNEDAAIYGLSFNLTGTTLYGVNNDGNRLETINTATGARTLVTTLSGVAAGHTLSGISFNPLTGALFLSSTNVSVSNLYTVDPSTGIATLVGATGIRALIDIAFDLAGNLFASDVASDSLFTLNTTTGASTLVGSIGLDLNFAQGMDFDFDTGTLYASLYTGGGNAQWATLDTSTGAATTLFAINREMEIAIARSNNAVPEPGTLALVGLSLAGLAAMRRRTR